MSWTKKCFSHEQHSLELRSSDRPFTCEGCKEKGFGVCYQCVLPNCNYLLHDACGEASNIAFHPFFCSHSFTLYNINPNAKYIQVCNACGNTIQGLHYHNDFPFTEAISIHPVCFKLKHVLQNDDGLTLHLRSKVDYSSYHLSAILKKKCQQCHSTRLSAWSKGWAYVSLDGTYRYHVACVRDMMYDKWKTSFCQGKMISSSSLNPLSVMPSPSCHTAIVQHNNIPSSKPTLLRMTTIAIRLIISAIFGEPTGVFYAATQLFSNK